MKNILFNSEFRVLYESELFATGKNRISRGKGSSRAESDPFFPVQYLTDTYFFYEAKSAAMSNLYYRRNFPSSIEWQSQK